MVEKFCNFLVILLTSCLGVGSLIMFSAASKEISLYYQKREAVQNITIAYNKGILCDNPARPRGEKQ